MEQSKSKSSPLNISFTVSDSILAESDEIMDNYNKLIRRNKTNDIKVILASIGSANQDQPQVQHPRNFR